MSSDKRVFLGLALLSLCGFRGVCAPCAYARTVTRLCTPTIVANERLVTPAQREAAGKIAQPPLTDPQDGFAWPDTPMGAIKSSGGYEFFGSDGGLHKRQFWRGHWYGNDKYGSATRTSGTLDNP